MEVKEPELCECILFNGRSSTSQNVTVEWSALISYFALRFGLPSTPIFNATLLTTPWQKSGIGLLTYFLQHAPSLAGITQSACS